MDPTILLILLQDGVVNGAIYALLALSLVLVFAVTRVVFIPQGEFVAYGALTYAALDSGQLPGSVWLLCALGAGACLASLWSGRHALAPRGVPKHRRSWAGRDGRYYNVVCVGRRKCAWQQTTCGPAAKKPERLRGARKRNIIEA